MLTSLGGEPVLQVTPPECVRRLALGCFLSCLSPEQLVTLPIERQFDVAIAAGLTAEDYVLATRWMSEHLRALAGIKDALTMTTGVTGNA